MPSDRESSFNSSTEARAIKTPEAGGSNLTKTGRKRKRRRTSESDEEKIDKSIEEKIEQSAKRNNLTPQNVKNILQKVVRNDHVMAIVRIREEELEREEQAEREQNIMAIERQCADEKDLPKLTRSKAKELNQLPLDLMPVKPIKPAGDELVALIREELHSDDDDEEYQPAEDDIETDDDLNTTTSDIDSQPATPSSQADPNEDHTSQPIYTRDGLFKIPRIRHDSQASLSEQDYVVAKQTRSKVSLAETRIEDIEHTFEAPDVPVDLYDTDQDPIYRHFLFATSRDMEMAEDADPDYQPHNIDTLPIEEYRNINITQEEIDDLLESLNEIYNDDSMTQINQVDNFNGTLVTPNKQPDEELSTPIQTFVAKDLATLQTVNLPYAMSTPTPMEISNTQAINMSLIDQSPVQRNPLNLSGDAFASFYEPVANNICYYTPIKETTPEVMVSLTAYTSNVGNSYSTTPAYTSIMLNIPTEFTTITSAMPPTIMSTQIQPESIVDCIDLNVLNAQIEAGPVRKRVGDRHKRYRYKTANFDELEAAKTPTKTFPTDAVGFTMEQVQILDQQLRMHVQLATQSYLQTYGNPEHYNRAHNFKKFLTELKELVEKGQIRRIFNLQLALDLIEKWENELNEDTAENTDLVEHIRSELDKVRKFASYMMKFHPRLLNIMCHSRVFLYANLLPPVPFRYNTQKFSEFVPAEDYVLAHLLEHYFEECRRRSSEYKLKKLKPVTLKGVCRYIAAHLNYIRDVRPIYDHIRSRSADEEMNPIKFYFKYNRAPRIRNPHEHEIFDEALVVEPAKRTVHELPTQFAEVVEKIIGHNLDKVLTSFIPIPPVNQATQIKKQAKETVQVKEEHEPTKQNLVVVKILYEPNANTQSITEVVEAPEIKLEKGQTLLTSFFKRKSINSVDAHQSQRIETTAETFDISEYLPDPLEESDDSSDGVEINTGPLPRQKIVAHFVKVCSSIRRFQGNSHVLFVYKCIIAFHRFIHVLVKQIANENMKEVQSDSEKLASTESIMINRRVQRLLHDKEHANDDNAGNGVVGTNASPTDSMNKRLPKSQRANDSTKLLLAENSQDSSEKDFLFAQHFMERVEEAFASGNNHHKFIEFLHILRSFSESQPDYSGGYLYQMLEKLFLPDHPELADMFLYFLTPSDAIEINKFMDYFLKTNLMKFLSKLNLYFQKQPAQIRKIMACLKDLSEEPDVTIERIRQRLVPLLKGKNPLLLEWFLQCIGPDHLDSTKDEYETLLVRKGNDCIDEDAETFEHVPQSAIAMDPNENPCHIRYINGHLFYGNRFPLPAKLSFSAMPCNVEPTAVFNEPERITSVTCDKTTQYRCAHSIKSFGDSKMRDLNKNHAEFDHAGNEEIEVSDDERPCTTPLDDKHCIDEDVEHTSPTAGSSHTSDHLLCDELLLRAHSIRLNPAVHTTLAHTNQELLNRLKQTGTTSDISLGDSSKEQRLSPKKQMQVTSKSGQTRKLGSPNTKKATNCRSPNNKKTSPQQQATIENAPNPDTSNAIQTARKLKKMFESGSTADGDEVSKGTSDNTKRCNVKRNQTTKPILKKQKRGHDEMPCIDANEAGPSSNEREQTVEGKAIAMIPVAPPAPTAETATTVKPSHEIDSKANTNKTPEKIPWSRDEDRVLLEVIKKGLEMSMEDISEIANQFPNKTAEHIRARVDFLIDYLTNL